MALVDLDATLNVAVDQVWGDPCTYVPLVSQFGAPSYDITGVFDEAHELILEQLKNNDIDAPGLSTTAPVLSVRRALLAADPAQGDEVEINGRRFVVWDPRPDGCGVVDLILRAAEDA